MSESSLEGEEFQNNFHKMPPGWQKVNDQFMTMLRDESFDDFIGLTETSKYLRSYHGTTREKLPLIVKDGGMRAFFEKDDQEPGVFVTTTPTNALHHAIENGPHDTLRKSGVLSGSHDPTSAILLLVEAPKEWLNNNPEAVEVRKSKLPSYILEAKGWPNTYRNIDAFISTLKQEIEEVKLGKEGNSFGIHFPTSFIPKDFIYIIDRDGQKIPIEQYSTNLT